MRGAVGVLAFFVAALAGTQALGQTPEARCPPLGDPILDGLIPLNEEQLRSLSAEGVNENSQYLGTLWGGSDPDAICYRYVDLSPAGECGLLESYGSPEPDAAEDGEDALERMEGGGIVAALSLLSSRTQEFPGILKGLGRWNAETSELTAQLDAEFRSAQAIVNGDLPLPEKRPALATPFGRATELTRTLAARAGVNYNILSGCGAADEDSQAVTFSVTPKANYARYILQYDFELCEALVDDPYDANKCDAWHVMSSGEHYLSGNYRYRVIWPDGETRDDTMSFAGIGSRSYPIER